VRSPRWSRFAGRACDPVGDPHWSSLFLKDCTSWEGIHAGAVREELQPVGRTHVGEICGELSPLRGASCWSRGRSVRSPPHEEEAAVEMTRDELTTTPFTIYLRHSGEEVENSGVKLSLGRREVWGEGVFKVWFYFS